jgi:hypothetical protein
MIIIKLTNVSYRIGGGKKPYRYRQNQNITLVLKEDYYTNNQILNIAIRKNIYPTNSTKIIRRIE